MLSKVNQIGKHTFNNIFYLCENFTNSKKIFQFEELKEYEYYSKILLYLSERLGKKFNDFKFIIYSKIAQKIEVEDSPLLINDVNERTILFLISDETGKIPTQLASKAKIAFKVLIKQNSIDNVHYFPLGYANGVQQTIIPINNRNINVFFIGQLGRSRIKLYKYFANKNYIPDDLLLLFKKYIKKDFNNYFDKSFIKFTTNFGEGLNLEQYNYMLNNSKIVICPYGAVTEETFRHYEAMRAGCVVVTLKMPDVFPYKDSPLVQINSWYDLNSTINKLLKNPTLIDEIHNKTLNWWNQKCSEESVANYVYEKIIESNTSLI